MGATGMLRQWRCAVKGMLPRLHGHRAKALADLSFGVAAAGHCHSGRLAAAVPIDAKPASTRRRVERLLANEAVDGGRVLGELSSAVLADWGGRDLLLILDETPKANDLRCMRVCVAYRGRALPLASECYAPGGEPRAMPELVCRLLRSVARRLPGDCRGTLLADRGLCWPAVLDCCAGLGWGYVLRAQGHTRVRVGAGECECEARSLVRRPGDRWVGRARAFKKAGWRDALVAVVWGPGCDEPWVLVADPTDPGGLRRAMKYARRNWCEQSFRDEKSAGFHWGDSRVDDPGRAARVVLLLALATLLAVSLGTHVLKRGLRRELDPHRRRTLSVFQMGLRWLARLIVLGRDLPHVPYLCPP